MQPILTFLTFNDQAEEAVTFYTSLFDHSAIKNTVRYGAGAPMPAGSLLSVEFQLNGQDYVAMNGGPHFSFANGISLLVTCDTQQEVDRLWDNLTEGGKPGPCGWLTDKFGVTWQIVPTVLTKLLRQGDPDKTRRVMHAMMQMGKLDIRTLENA
jgi:predicted 3-demethylubiquinone-9 3-methyltransferase (glyoxalase superfamily)